MPMISQLWTKVKSSLIKALGGDTAKDEKVSESKGAEIKHVPGLDCPQCGFRIQVSIPMLLSGEPIICPACGLKLSADQEKSQACLNELRKVNDAIQKAEEAKIKYR